MTTEELIKKVRKIEIKSKGLSNHIFAGAYQTAFKGRGMIFSEVREYAPGDDVRDIDWNVTARFSSPHVKVYEEERELNLMLMIDISNSIQEAAHSHSKREIVAELAAILAFSALQNNDQVGAIFFSNGMDLYIPPKKGKKHILSIIRNILTTQPKDSGTTNFQEALSFLNSVSKKKNIVFMMSDFLGELPDKELRMSAMKNDFIALSLHDTLDTQLPNLGLLKVRDSETRKWTWLSTNQKQLQKQWAHYFEEHQWAIRQKLLKYRAHFLPLYTEEDYLKTLKMFFQRR